MARALEVGGVSINNVMATEANPALPFGGVKNSGFGRYKGEHGLHAFCNVKSVLVDKDSAKIEANWYPYTKEKYRLFTNLTVQPLRRRPALVRASSPSPASSSSATRTRRPSRGERAARVERRGLGLRAAARAGARRAAAADGGRPRHPRRQHAPPVAHRARARQEPPTGGEVGARARPAGAHPRRRRPALPRPHVLLVRGGAAARRLRLRRPADRLSDRAAQRPRDRRRDERGGPRAHADDRRAGARAHAGGLLEGEVWRRAAPLRVCIDLDMSWRPFGLHVGVQRSPVRDVDGFRAPARRAPEEARAAPGRRHGLRGAGGGARRRQPVRAAAQSDEALHQAALDGGRRRQAQGGGGPAARARRGARLLQRRRHRLDSHHQRGGVGDRGHRGLRAFCSRTCSTTTPATRTGRPSASPCR